MKSTLSDTTSRYGRLNSRECYKSVFVETDQSVSMNQSYMYNISLTNNSSLDSDDDFRSGCRNVNMTVTDNSLFQDYP